MTWFTVLAFPHSHMFRFQQFSVSDVRSAMKVGTDGILLGAWADVSGVNRILDVGTGSGLIAMIAAQRTDQNVAIDGIDNDADSILDAHENASRSPWSGRMTMDCCALQEFACREENRERYGSVLCNPPFFESGPFRDGESQRNARHQLKLTTTELFENVNRVLDSAGGTLSLVVPVSQLQRAIEVGSLSRLHLQRQTAVRPLIGHPPKRVLLEFGRSAVKPVVEELTLELEHHRFTPEFAELTRDLYLRFAEQ